VIELCRGNVIVNFELLAGINNGVLVPYHYFGCFDDVDYSQMRSFATGYTVQDLNRALIIPERDEAIIQKWRDAGENLPTLAFCCSHQHARRMVAAFNAAGIPAAEYLGTTLLDNRAALVEKLQFGDLKGSMCRGCAE
jgi:superfamily II DNA or RNA helicase